MARIGQIFSSTKVIQNVGEYDLVRVDDIERGPYCFSDGCGNLSKELAAEIDKKYGLKECSAYQIRLGGIKGVLMYKPELEGKVVEYRPS